jgi:CHAD domain-containing protein
MPYSFQAGETEAGALRRCAREQLDLAITELTDGVKTDPVTAIHDARKALKKERSLLRLARGTLRPAERRALNAVLRDAGRRLSDARDAEVMIQAVDDLSERYAGQLPKRTFTAVRKHLDARAAAARGSLSTTVEVADELKSLRAGLDEWSLRRDGWQAIGEGLERSYERGRKAYRQARRKPTTENLHEWRKRAKDLWYHVRLLEPIAPGAMAGHADDAHLLSDLLGDDHDLAVLRETLAARDTAVAADVESVLTLIDHRRDQLQAEAMQLGARVYAEKPQAFTRRMRTYWKVWRTDAPAVAGPVHLRGRVAASPGT